MRNRSSTSHDDLRADRARYKINLFELSKRLGDIPPWTISSYLTGRLAMPDGVAERIRRAMEDLASAGAAR